MGMKQLGYILLICAVGACGETQSTAVDAVPVDVGSDASADAALFCDDTAPVFNSRIKPLLVESRPSSCNGCHLTGLDLEDFVRGSACQSMACLVERQLVDFSAPADSKILELIDRGIDDGEPATQRAAEVERAAFASRRLRPTPPL